jgi:hypothetical protein
MRRDYWVTFYHGTDALNRTITYGVGWAMSDAG